MALDNVNAIPSSSSSLPLEKRVVIITGASGGIGSAIARHLASLSAKLVLSYSTNVSDPNQVKSLFDHAEKVFNSQPHILVNSAGVLDPKYSTISNTNIEDFDHIFNINAKGACMCAREAANRLVRGGGGRIILISSSMVGGLKPGFGAYTTSKAAVETMMRILAKELKGTGITANKLSARALHVGK
ncbi:hypothetical protein MKW92_008001 [Papaver armeniacum]|nr:hypothetical protein MKW92_008001 [Papaver armeniacum]